MVCIRLGPARIAVAAQVHQDDREVLGQLRRDAMPDGMGLRVAMKQQQGRAASADAAMQAHAVARQIEGGERGEHGPIVRCTPRSIKQQSAN